MKLKITMSNIPNMDVEVMAKLLSIIRRALDRLNCGTIEIKDNAVVISDGVNFISKVEAIGKQLSMFKKVTASIQNISNYLDIIESYDDATAEYIGDITKDRIAQYIRDAKEGDLFAVVYNNSWITDLMAEDHNTVVYGMRTHIVKLVNNDVANDILDLDKITSPVRFFKVVIKDNTKTGVEITTKDLKKILADRAISKEEG